jgi:hypothetical protein
MRQVNLSLRAQRDLKRLGRGRERDQLLAALAAIAEVPVAGESRRDAAYDVWPWLRVRVGNYRILLAPAAEAGATERPVQRDDIIVERIVHRRELERAVRGLSLSSGQV